MKLLGPKRRVGQGKTLEVETSEGWMTLQQIFQHTGVPVQTLRTRIGRYGITDERVLDPEPQTHHPMDAWDRMKPHPWDRRRCRRNGQNCIRYGECQSRRLRLTEEPWIPPADTDKCYVEPDLSHLWRYASALAGKTGFGNWWSD